MALSVYKPAGGAICPLGFISVANNGTPVNIMYRADANNLNSPETTANSNTIATTPTCLGIGIQGFSPGNNNNGMIPNTGYVYMVKKGIEGPGNRSDSGVIVKVISPGGDYFFAPDGSGKVTFSPYEYYIDSDVNGEGALVTLYGTTRG